MPVAKQLESVELAPPALGEPYLLTPGPLTTAYAVKHAMLRDWGSWDSDFKALTATMRRQLLAMVRDTEGVFDCVPMQGSGSFCVEAMLGSFVPRDGKLLVLANGAYGLRAAQTMRQLGRAFTLVNKGDFLAPRAADVSAALKADSTITHVLAIHCETSSGILNPVSEISDAVYAHGRKLLIDSMSAFGALPVEVSELRYEAIVSSANKCIEGVPGFGFVIARKSELAAAEGRSHSLSLDVHAQWATFEKTGQWRFTPPTHVVAAFIEALRLHDEEGGVAARGARYGRNRDVLVAGMRAAGFETLLPDEWLSPIIVTFFCPAHANFAFDRFYALMKAKGFVIYPGKLTFVESFRVGCIGHIDEHVMRRVVEAARQSLVELSVPSAAPPTLVLDERARLFT
jgi:2-aminoethylphosphonate-pyruvate transaminase